MGRESGTGQVEEDEESRVLEQMRAARAEGATPQQIAGMLNKAGIPCKRAGKRWYPSTVKEILKREQEESGRGD